MQKESENIQEKPEKIIEKNPCNCEIKKQKTTLLFIGLVLVSLFFGLIGGFLGGDLALESRVNNKDNIVFSKEEDEDKMARLIESSDLEDLQKESLLVNVIKNASPAVVSILVTKDVPKMNNIYIDPFSGGFFMPFQRDERQSVEPEMETKKIGGGSGFIVDSGGYIITNRHVVDDQDADYTVILNDGKKYTAEVLARDSFLDLAVLKITTDDDLTVLSLGDSDELKIGQTAIAIGNSLGEFSNSVSKGIISGLKRNLIAKSSSFGQGELLEGVIQTDAAINPGNSGGPLVNLKGEVVGVSVAMAMGAENVGFAIPVNEIKSIYQSVKDNGRIVRPFIGVRYVLVDEELSKENNLDFAFGALIVRGSSRSELAIIPGSPADKAGLEENDIILEVDGVQIDSDNDLGKVVRKKSIGSKVRFRIWRAGEIKELEIILEEASS